MNLISLDSPAAVTVGTALTTLAQFPLNGKKGRASVQVSNTGSTALSGLQVQIKASDAGAWLPLLSGTDFNQAIPLDLPFVSSTSPATLAGGATANFNLALSGAPVQCRIQAQVGSGTTTVQVYGTASVDNT